MDEPKPNICPEWPIKPIYINICIPIWPIPQYLYTCPEWPEIDYDYDCPKWPEPPDFSCPEWPKIDYDYDCPNWIIPHEPSFDCPDWIEAPFDYPTYRATKLTPGGYYIQHIPRESQMKLETVINAVNILRRKNEES